MARKTAPNMLSEMRLDPFSSEQLHLQIQRQMREKIRTHQLMPGQKLPTNHEMSAALKVSYETVQRAMTALADHGIVVRRQRKGTFVNQALTPRTVGIFCTQSVFNPEASPSAWLIARHLCTELRTQKRDAQIYYIPEGASPERNKTYRDLHSDLEAHRLAGLIFIGYSPHEPSELQLMETAARRAIPVIAVASGEDCPHTVHLDFLDFHQRGLRYLANQHCRRAAVVESSDASNGATRVVMELAEREGLVLRPRDIFAAPLDSTASAIAFGEELGRTFDLDRYDAALLCDDIVALGFARGLWGRKVTVPQQLHVATMWNRGNPLSLMLPFVRFDADGRQWARRSVEMLDTLIQGCQVQHPHQYMKLEGPIESQAPRAPQFMEAIAC
jgi:DNA-binding LacI/PurR family transcriptional regulator